MSPENLSSQTYSEKSDVWSYGALLVELLTGKEPFPEKDILSVAVGVRDGKFTALDFVPMISKPPKWVRQMIKACFTFDFNDRPSFDDLVQIMNANVPEGYEINAEQDDADHVRTKKGNETATGGVAKPGQYDDANNLNSNKKAQQSEKPTKTDMPVRGAAPYSDSIAMTEMVPVEPGKSENKLGNYTSFGGDSDAEVPPAYSEDKKPAPSANYATMPDNSEDSSSDSSSSNSSGPSSSSSTSES
jgi:serine/threonine protein kinase